MIFGKRSDRELKYAKAKAKATEFFVDPSSVPHFKLNSDELHYTSILTLSTYVNSRLSGNDGAEYMTDLQKVGSFYDSASNDERYREYSDGYWTLAMATYYLLGNYGSAKVCAEKVKEPDFYGARARTLYDLIMFLLVPSQPVPPDLAILADYLAGEDVDRAEVISAADSLLTEDSPEDTFFSGVLYVSISDAVSCSARALLPEYTHLDINDWRSFLSTEAAPKLLWQAQRQIGLAGVFAGENAFIQLPTGSGKTRSVELLLRSRILAKHCRLAVVVAPLRALCSEIARNLSAALKGIARVRQASDVMEIDSWFEESASDHEIIVSTPEKLGFIIHHDPLLLQESDLFVFDEAHLLDSESRGPGYELLLTEIFRFKPDVQKVLISAVVSNADEIAKWAFGDSERIVKGGNIQVTEKSIGLIQNKGSRVSYVNREDISSEDYFVMVDVEPQELDRFPRERKRRYFPDYSGNDPEQARDLSIYYANRLLPNGACAIYVPKKSSLPSLLRRLDELLRRSANITNLLLSIPADEKKRLTSLVCKHYGKDNWITPGINAGILPHYGDLQGAIRQAVEYEIERGDAKCVACTSTLAEGVNLPIKYLIITGARKGYETPRTRDFQNLIGRTARSGKYSEGSVLLADNTEGFRNKEMYSTLMKESETERCGSAIVNLLSDATTQDNREVFIPGESIVNVILEHLTNPRLEYELASAFSRTLGCDDSRARELASRRMRPLEAIESYLSGVLAANMGEVDVLELCASTYAYTSSDEETQERLIKLFQAIYESLESVSKENAALFHMMQLGTRTASSLIDWIESPEGKRFIEGGCSEIQLAVHQFMLPNPDIAGQLNEEQLSLIIGLWIDGANLSQITNALNEQFDFRHEFKIGKTEKIVSGVVRFTFAHFVSSMLDVVREKDGLSTADNIEKLSAFQRKVKYGVSSLSEAMICEEVIDDRMIAKEIVSITGMAASLSDPAILKFGALANREAIEKYADSLPVYCSKSILEWISS